MSDKRRNHLKFLSAIIGFVLIIAVMVVGLVYLNLYAENQNIFYIVLFACLLLLIFLTQVFKILIDTLVNASFLIRIKENASQPLDMARTKDIDSLRNYLVKQEFSMFANDQDHFLFYRSRKDHIKKMLRGYILEIVVYVTPSNEEYFLEIVDEEIHKLQETFIEEKKRLDVMIVTQIKSVDDLNEKERRKLSEVIFMRSQAGVISTINVGLHQPSNKAVLLYSDKYSPSLYYKYHVEQIKKMI